MTTYPYLFANIPLIFLIVLAAKTVLPCKHGQLSLLSGYACIPCCIMALVHEGAYWNPVRLGGLPIGVEDVVFTFISGSMGWFLSGWPFRHRLLINPKLSTFLVRSALLGISFTGFCCCLWWAGVTGLDNTLAAALAAVLVLLVIRKQLFPLAATGILLFVPIYFLIVKIQFHIWPDYPLQWNPGTHWDALILGVPSGEIAWAAVFSAAWPVIMGFVFDIRWKASAGLLRADHGILSLEKG